MLLHFQTRMKISHIQPLEIKEGGFKALILYFLANSDKFSEAGVSVGFFYVIFGVLDLILSCIKELKANNSCKRQRDQEKTELKTVITRKKRYTKNTEIDIKEKIDNFVLPKK